MGTRYRGTALERQCLCAFINLMRAADSILARTQPHLTEQGLTNSQFGVLEALMHLGPLCQHALGEKLLRTGGNITMIVDNLEKRSLVERKRSVEDRRYITVALTGKGRELINRVFPRHVKVIVREFQTISSAEREQLRGICRKLGIGAKGSTGGCNENSDD